MQTRRAEFADFGSLRGSERGRGQDEVSDESSGMEKTVGGSANVEAPGKERMADLNG